MPASQPLIFRKGLDMKEAVAGELAAAYDSAVVDDVRARDFTYTSGRLTIHLAREFGFCYGVDRAVDLRGNDTNLHRRYLLLLRSQHHVPRLARN